jgi:hypothetical protein
MVCLSSCLPAYGTVNCIYAWQIVDCLLTPIWMLLWGRGASVRCVWQGGVQHLCDKKQVARFICLMYVFCGILAVVYVQGRCRKHGIL